MATKKKPKPGKGKGKKHASPKAQSRSRKPSRAAAKKSKHGGRGKSARAKSPPPRSRAPRPPTPVEGPFSGSHVYVGDLDARAAVRAFARLLVDETVASGEPATSVAISYDVTTPDGGIDAEAQVTSPSRNNLLFPGRNHFQIKTGNYPTTASSLRKVLYTPSGVLHPRVKECFDAGGKFTLVLFGVDKPDPKFSGEVARVLKAELKKKHPEYINPNISVLKKQQIGSLIDLYPPIFLSIVPTPLAGLQSFDLWGNEREMKRPFTADARHGEEVIKPLRQALRDRTRSHHIRVTGQAGVGKTRTVREALASEEFSPFVAYSPSGHAIRSHPIINHIRQASAPFPIVLVVDECPMEIAVAIWNQLEGTGGLVKLVTIYHETEVRHGNGVIHIDMPAPSTETTKSILSSHGVTQPSLGTLTELCEGSPRIAHSVGETWQSEGGPLTDLTTVSVYDRFVSQPDPTNSEPAKLRHRILEFLALFKQFGWKGESAKEIDEILQFIRTEEPSITRGTLRETIQNFQARKILQGDYILYITPMGLHVYMWVQWWKRYGGNSLNIGALSKLSPPLLRAYMRMWEYAAESPAASKIVRTLLDDESLFSDVQSLESGLGGTFFRALARADPSAGLKTLERILGGRSRADLLGLKNGRREVIDSLESIAIEPDLFEGAAKILRQLAVAENEPWSNNATGVFADLFSYAPGAVAPTAAPPSIRLPILRETLLNSDPAMQTLGIKALERSLRADHFVRTVGAERRGIRVASAGWMPGTYKDWSEAYRATWDLALAALDEVKPSESAAIVRTMGDSARSLLARFPWSEPWVREGLRKAGLLNEDCRRIVLDDVLHIIHFDGKDLSEEALRAWTNLRDELTGSTFHDRVLRYVRMNAFTDHFDDNGNRADQAERPIQDLAREAANDFSVLAPELRAIMTAEASNAFRFGRAYGLHDEGAHLREIWEQYDGVETPKPSFLVGYYSGLREKRPDKWEESLDDVASSASRRQLLAELSQHRDITLRAVNRILTAVERGHLNASAFNLVWLERLDDDSIRSTLERLYAVGTAEAAGAVVTALHRTFRMRDADERRPAFPAQLALDALKRASVPARSSAVHAAVMDDYYWKEVALHVMEAGPPHSEELAAFMIALFGETESVLESSFDQAAEALATWIEQNPAEAWPLVGDRLLSKGGSVISLVWFLREKRGRNDDVPPIVSKIPVDIIMDWVSKDPVQRAWIAAEIADIDLKPGSLAYEILDRHGAAKEVRRSLSANWHTGGFVGSEVLYHERRKAQLLTWKEAASSPGVLAWIDDELRRAALDIEGAAEREEQLFRR